MKSIKGLGDMEKVVRKNKRRRKSTNKIQPKKKRK